MDAHFDNQFTVLQLVHILASYLNVHHKKKRPKTWDHWLKTSVDSMILLKDRRIDLGALQGGRNFVSPEIPPGNSSVDFRFFLDIGMFGIRRFGMCF